MATPPAESAATPPSSEPKPGFWGKVFSFTPIVLTIVATTLAGISSSELTQSMYYRSLAAQNQSKAGDQWSFFQVKRVRGTTLESTGELLQSLGTADTLTLDDLPRLLDQIDASVRQLPAEAPQDASPLRGRQRAASALAELRQLLRSAPEQAHLSTLFAGTFPVPAVQPHSDDAGMSDRIEEVRKAIAARRTERETAPQVRLITLSAIELATQRAEEDADAFDRVTEPYSRTVGRVRQLTGVIVAELKRSGGNPEPLRGQLQQLNLGVRIAVTDFNARRYRQESFLNQRVAEMYEVRVRRSGVESDRHRERSTLFFYAMIAAQAGVTIASLSIFRSRKAIFWLLATIAGLGSLGFSGWVFVTR